MVATKVLCKNDPITDVELQTVLGDLERENKNFEEELRSKKSASVKLPWEDMPDPELARKHILALSAVRCPPVKTFND